MDEFVWLRYPDHGGVAAIAAAAAPQWQAMGWEPCDPPNEDEASQEQGQPEPAVSKPKTTNRAPKE